MTTTAIRESPGSQVPSDRLDLLLRTLAYARERDYTGWDYGDGMSSQFLQQFPVDNKWLNLAVQEGIKRAPVNLRPLFRVDQRRNFMGAALFAMASLEAYRLTERQTHARDARDLVEWLLDEHPRGYSGFCCTHPHDVQTLDGVVPAGTPGVVGTSFGVKALLRADEQFGGGYGDVARTAADFVFDDLGYEEDGERARINYKVSDDGDHYTLNAVALGARLLVDLYDHTGESMLRDAARKLLAYVAGEQTDVGGWYYRDPPEASHLSMDSHHNGFVIESFQQYRQVTGSTAFDEVLRPALSFYRDTLFEPTGVPNFDESSPYPRDVHAAAQGILVFTYAGDYRFAERIIDWTLAHLYAGDGRFYSRKYRFHTKRHVLMRWCEAWMAYALAEYLRVRSHLLGYGRS